MTSPMWLPFTDGARCGYCNRVLSLADDGTWRCARCAPLLADVATAAGWVAFARRAARDYWPDPPRTPTPGRTPVR